MNIFNWLGEHALQAVRWLARMFWRAICVISAAIWGEVCTQSRRAGSWLGRMLARAGIATAVLGGVWWLFGANPAAFAQLIIAGAIVWLGFSFILKGVKGNRKR